MLYEVITHLGRVLAGIDDLARPTLVIVMSHPEGERIPLTIADFNREKGTITLVIQAVGKSTREMQQSCQVRNNFV